MSPHLRKTTLLDHGRLPVAELARIALREGVRPRSAYQAHKWFARRFAVTARALLVGAATPETGRFWANYYKGDCWKGRTVLDPFAGGGVMLLEAARLGADVYGVDIEPVAVAIARFQTQLRKLPDLTPALDDLGARVGEKLAPFYRAENADGQRETLLHAFWVQTVKCRECLHAFDAHPTFRIAWDEQTKRQWVACRECSKVKCAAISAKSIRCECGVVTNTEGRRVEKGEICCPRCGTKEPLIGYARRTRRQPTFRLFAVETIPAGEERRYNLDRRTIRSATDFDIRCYASAKWHLARVLREHPKILPVGKIPKRYRTDNRLLDYQYTDYRGLFNARQRLHLALLGREIQRLKGPIKTAMSVAFSDHLTTNNMMCAYAGGWRRLTPLFSIRAYRHICRPVEINPWLRHNGRGTFPNAVRAVVKASESLKSPMEPTPQGLLRPVNDENIGHSSIRCCDARALKHIKSQSIDLVLTDPPYFDYISYSELGHFFTPWMARLGLIAPAKALPAAQLASTSRSEAGEKQFAKKISKAFAELRRVMKPNARMAFTYQNLDGRGWAAISSALAKAGIRPFEVFPLYGDSSASLHKTSQSISWDCVLVCMPSSPIHNFKVSPASNTVGHEVAIHWKKQLASKGLALTSGDQTNIAHAAAIVAEFQARAAQPARRVA